MINSFKGEYRFLSNFWPVSVTLDGVKYPSVEHAYVAAKTTDAGVRNKILETETPGQVKRLGRKIKIREDWDIIKLSVMEKLVSEKFEVDLELRQKLVETYPQELVEGNTWGDTFWGVCNGVGENNLGKILMKIRKKYVQ